MRFGRIIYAAIRVDFGMPNAYRGMTSWTNDLGGFAYQEGKWGRILSEDERTQYSKANGTFLRKIINRNRIVPETAEVRVEQKHLPLPSSLNLLLARWCGIQHRRTQMSTGDLLGALILGRPARAVANSSLGRLFLRCVGRGYIPNSGTLLDVTDSGCGNKYRMITG